MAFKFSNGFGMFGLSEKQKHVWHVAKAFLFGWIFLISIHWLTLGLEGQHILSEWFEWFEWFGINYSLLGSIFFSFLLVIWSSLMLYKHRRRFLPVRSLSRTASINKIYSNLILIVSTPNPEPSFPEGQIFPPTIGSVTVGKGSLDGDIELLKAARWNWQQLLRTLKALNIRSKLKYICLIGSSSSPGSNGSYDWLEPCKSLIKYYLPETEVVNYREPVDFENLRDLMDAINTIIQSAKEKGVDEKDIIIDVTGGLKTASIAAALATLHNKVTFQYVQTYAPYEVFAYDVISENHFSLPE